MTTYATQVFTSGEVFTGGTGEELAEAFALDADGTIMAIGKQDTVTPLIGPTTIVTELGGAFVMPGFVDAHNHYHLQGQTELFELLVESDLSLDELLARIAQRLEHVPSGQWLVVSPYGAGLANEIATGDALARLDAISGDHPVMIREYSRHNRWVNSEAMRRAGIDQDTLDPEHGLMVRDSLTGALTGVMVESAGIRIEHTWLAARKFTVVEHQAKVRRAVEILNGYGITAMQDGAASLEAMEGSAALDEGGELTAWIVSSMPVNEQIFGFDPQGDALLELGERYRTTHHRPDFIKIFMDGVPPAHTAVFVDAYLPSTEFGKDYRAEPLLDVDSLVAVLERAAQRGLSAKIHCTGDGSVRVVLDAVERLRRYGWVEQRYQVAHANFVAASDIERFAELNTVVEISPYYWTPGPVPAAIAGVMGDELVTRMHPNRDLIDAGALIAVGSDWPCSDTPNPWLAIHGLVNRTDPLGQFPGVLVPEQAVTVDEALRMTTINGANALGIGERTGSLEVGKTADFLVASANPFTVPNPELGSISTISTWFHGKRVK